MLGAPGGTSSMPWRVGTAMGLKSRQCGQKWPARDTGTGFTWGHLRMSPTEMATSNLADPYSALRRCNRLLRPGGIVAIKVHNIACLYARLAGSHFYAIIPPFHITYFSERTLKMALERAGFAHKATTYVSHTLFLKTVPYRLAGTKRSGLAYGSYRLLDRLPLR